MKQKGEKPDSAKRLVRKMADAVLDADERNGIQLVSSGGIERLVSLLPSKRPKRTHLVLVDSAILLLTGLLEINGTYPRRNAKTK